MDSCSVSKYPTSKKIQYLQNYPGPVDVSTQLSIHGSELLFDTKVLPTYTATIHGLTQQFSSLSAAIRLSKRWVHSQMLSGLVPDVTIEMLVVFVYLHSELFSSPGHHVTGFYAFYHS